MRASGDVGEDKSYNAGEVFEIMEPPPAHHQGFGTAKGTGEGKPRADVHRDGDWHHSVHVWLHDPRTDSVLIQRRSKYKDTNPDMFDVSAAGHIAMGDIPLETAVREMEEELGISTQEKNFNKLFTAVSEAKGETEKHGKYVCREFQEVYLVDIAQVENSSASPVEIKVADGEVEEAKWIPKEDLISALATNDPTYVPRSSAYVRGLADALEVEISKKARTAAYGRIDADMDDVRS
eukprot:CAMPEP_0167816294 /NCGR_PEP_ID=MMETSP0112_2-20121227/3516_1 /TAXON_ID=91324 /ORGANISM="Lotharella globosa, Strain CCCM811" /LENGTH=235 /DNA_ID=CAMNT_0007715845 /DNA_START=86 /DNA_END=791 /DNA_ORIENTATION=+